MNFSKLKKAILVATMLVTGSTTFAATESFSVRFQNGVDGYTGTMDTYVCEDGKNDNRGNQASFQMDEDYNNDWPFGSEEEAQGMLRFTDIFGSSLAMFEGDTIDLSYIPANATITSATLGFYCYGSGSGGDLKLITRNWNESSTWNSVSGGIGNDTGANVSGLNSGTGWQTVNVTNNLRSWLAGSSANYGWAFISDGRSSNEYRSSEFGTVAYRPYLTVNFTVESMSVPEPATQAVPEPGLIGLAGIGLVFTLIRKRSEA